MLTETLTIHDDTLDKTHRQIVLLQRQLEQREYDIGTLEDRLKSYRARPEQDPIAHELAVLLHDFGQKYFPGIDVHDLAIREQLRDEFGADTPAWAWAASYRTALRIEGFVEERISRYTNELKEAQEERTRVLSEIARHKLTLETHEPCNRVIDLNDVRRAVEGSQVSNLHLAVHNDNSALKFLRFNVDNVVAKVNGLSSDTYLGDVTIKIPPSYVYMARDGFKVVPRDLADGVDGYTVDSSHPHTLSDHVACAGDFAGSYAEAIAEHDFVTAISVVMLFLEQVDSYDAAGQNWKRWINRLLTDPAGDYAGYMYMQVDDSLVPIHLMDDSARSFLKRSPPPFLQDAMAGVVTSGKFFYISEPHLEEGRMYFDCYQRSYGGEREFIDKLWCEEDSSVSCQEELV